MKWLESYLEKFMSKGKKNQWILIPMVISIPVISLLLRNMEIEFLYEVIILVLFTICVIISIFKYLL